MKMKHQSNKLAFWQIMLLFIAVGAAYAGACLLMLSAGVAFFMLAISVVSFISLSILKRHAKN